MLRRRLPALDGLRAVAVAVVVAYHAGFPIPGDLGVSLFFVLSGFLITWLLLVEFQRTGTISFRQFYIRRTFRIFPAYYGFLVVSFLADSVLGDRWSLTLIWSALTYTVNYYNAFTGGHHSTIAHAWSLAIEEQFYLIWPAVFLVAAGWGRSWLARTMGVLIGAVAAWRTVLVLTDTASVTYVYNAFDTRFDQLAIGCLLAVVATTPRSDHVAFLLSRFAWAPLLTIAAILFSRSGVSTSWHYSAGFTVDAFLLAVLIVQLMLLTHSALWKWLEWGWVRWLGLLSYPIYLYHIWGLGAGKKVPGVGPELQVVAGIAITLGLAAASYYALEKPALALRDRLRERRTAATPAPA